MRGGASSIHGGTQRGKSGGGWTAQGPSVQFLGRSPAGCDSEVLGISETAQGGRYSQGQI